jgi:hypothetical protein
MKMKLTTEQKNWLTALRSGNYEQGHHYKETSPPTLQHLNINTPPSDDEPKKLKWTVVFEVSEEWVADGFILTSERALEMLANDLGYADMSTELRARVIEAPDVWTLANTQGYTSVKTFLTDSKLRVNKDGIVESKYDV